MMKRVTVICMCIALLVVPPLSAQTGDAITAPTLDPYEPPPSPSTPEDIGVLMTQELLSRQQYMRYGRDGLHYAEACAAVGALRFSAGIDDDEAIEKLIERYAVLLDEESDLISRKPHVDQSVIGIVPLQIYLITGDERYLAQGLTFADRQWANPTEDGLTSETRWWIDDMYMVGMLQMQAYRATGNEVYADRAALELAAYLDRLQQDNGLFYHGLEAPFHWGRGNGWVAAGVTEVLSSLPEDHELMPVLMSHYKRMMEALLAYQNDTGMWRQLVDDPEAWDESSCTAMFAYAFAVGVKKGWLDEATYKPRVQKAWDALTKLIDENGRLSEICIGTGQQNDRQFYLTRPRQTGDFHGQAPVLWLASEMIESNY